jgi:tetratricopeptide (TPR) repeat protein
MISRAFKSSCHNYFAKNFFVKQLNRRMKTIKIRWQPLSVGNFLIYCFFIFALPLRAQNPLPQPEPGELAPADPTFDAPLSRGIALVYSDRFEESLALFDSLQKAHPGHPGPYFYKAATYQTWMSSYRFNGFQKELEGNVEEAITKGTKLLRTTNDPWLLFYMGAAYGYRAFYKFRNYHWLDAYQDSRKSLNYIQTGLQRQPKLYDAYLGLGSYDYWSTAKSIVLKLLTFLIGDKRDFGLEEIKLAMQHGRYSRDEARLVLVTALFDYGKYEQALAALDQKESPARPASMTELYLHGRLMFEFGRWPEVESIFRELLQRLENHRYQSIGYQAECKYRVAKALQQQGHHKEALALADEALALSEKRNAKTELESDLGSFSEMLKALKRLNDELKDAN